MKLSYRDKIILAVFVFVMTLFVGFIIVIKPQIKDISDSKQILSEKQAEKENIELNVASLDNLKVSIENENNRIKELIGFFTPEMYTNDIDKFIYEIAKENSISIDSMILTPTEETELNYYDPSNTNNEKNENALKINADCAVAVVNFKTDNQSIAKNFLDDIDELDTSIIVDNCSIVYNKEESGYDVTISILFYSVTPEEALT